jgi:ATP-dependent DNA helicase RecG
MDVKALLKEGESETLEFKESLQLKDEIGITVSAFSNSKGGVILVGVSDTVEIRGVQVGKKTLTDLAEYVKKNTDPSIYPEIKIHTIENKKIVFIKIKESSEKPVFFKSHTYKRVGTTNQKISSSEIRKLAREPKRLTSWDEQIHEDTTLEDIDWKFVNEFFLPLYEEVSQKKISGKPQLILESLTCIKSNKPTNAGILLFGRDLQKFFPNSYIALARYRGNQVSTERLDYKEFSGNLFQQIDECDKYIKTHIAVMSRLHPYQVQREDIPEYGIFSIRELITNAICHRDYENQNTKVIIKIFDERIEFYNPGGLPQDITPKNITEKQFSRNPIIAKVLAKVKYIEELGEGWDKIIKEHKEHPLKPRLPKIKSDRYTTTVTIFSTRGKFETIEGQVELNERQKYVLERIREQGFTRSIEIQNQFGVTRDTANRDLNYLIKLNLIKREGRGKKVRYALR